jgi:hypothetical protein
LTALRASSGAPSEFQRALDTHPNFAAAHGYLGSAFAFNGQSDEAIPHSEPALHMSPYDPENAIFNVGLAGRSLPSCPTGVCPLLAHSVISLRRKIRSLLE